MHTHCLVDIIYLIGNIQKRNTQALDSRVYSYGMIKLNSLYLTKCNSVSQCENAIIFPPTEHIQKLQFFAAWVQRYMTYAILCTLYTTSNFTHFPIISHTFKCRPMKYIGICYCSDRSVFPNLSVKFDLISFDLFYTLILFRNACGNSVNMSAKIRIDYTVHRIGFVHLQLKVKCSSVWSFFLYFELETFVFSLENSDLLTIKSNSITCYSIHWTQQLWLASNWILLVKIFLYKIEELWELMKHFRVQCFKNEWRMRNILTKFK